MCWTIEGSICASIVVYASECNVQHAEKNMFEQQTTLVNKQNDENEREIEIIMHIIILCLMLMQSTIYKI